MYICYHIFHLNKLLLYCSLFPETHYSFCLLPGDGEGGGDLDDGDKKKRQTRGGKGAVKAKKKTEPLGIKLATGKRGKKKTVTIVIGLASYGRCNCLILGTHVQFSILSHDVACFNVSITIYISEVGNKMIQLMSVSHVFNGKQVITHVCLPCIKWKAMDNSCLSSLY